MIEREVIVLDHSLKMPQLFLDAIKVGNFKKCLIK